MCLDKYHRSKVTLTIKFALIPLDMYKKSEQDC